jgi:hypothetical protein
MKVQFQITFTTLSLHQSPHLTTLCPLLLCCKIGYTFGLVLRYIHE